MTPFERINQTPAGELKPAKQPTKRLAELAQVYECARIDAARLKREAEEHRRLLCVAIGKHRGIESLATYESAKPFLDIDYALLDAENPGLRERYTSQRPRRLVNVHLARVRKYLNQLD